MASNASLKTYRDKRDFGLSPEPSGAGKARGETKSPWKKRGNPIFVIQKHAARSLHYDFRLEVDGVLKSWAVPKGPSTNPADKRLAVHVEDHPLDYADFEGVIPKGQYGGGTVIVWDAGPYHNLKMDKDGREIPVAKAMEMGAVEIWLQGKKLQGGYALIHSKLRGDDKNWLLVKMKDAGANARRNPVKTEPKSVLSGKTIQEVAQNHK
ncbi:MAG: DNA polymerase ligase N-terminal domain-containing protein [Phycisphaeraceae bacterium]